MTQNPFEAPRAADPYQAPAGPAHTEGTGRFDLGVAVQEAWTRTTENAGVLIGGSILGMILILVSYVTILGIFLLVPIFAYGGIKMLLDAYDGQAEIGSLFAGFQSYGQALGGMLMLLLAMIAIQLPTYALSFAGVYFESMALSMLSNVVSLVVTFTLTIRLYFAPFFIVDQRMGGVDAIKASWEVTREQKLMTFLLLLLAGIIGMLGIFALVVGLFFTLPLSYMIYVSAYRQIVGSPAAAAPAY